MKNTMVQCYQNQVLNYNRLTEILSFAIELVRIWIKLQLSV